MDNPLPSSDQDKRELLALAASNEVPGGLSADAATRLLAAATSVMSGAAPGFRSGLVSLALRSVETLVLAHPRILGMSRYWTTYAGRHSDIVREVVRDLVGIDPPDEFIAYIVKCAGSHFAQHGAKAAPTHTDFQDCASHLVDSGIKELRCQVCGYHFRREDLGSQREQVADAVGLAFAATLYPGRSEDQWKPTLAGKKASISLTRLNVDHLTPEAGHGWTGADNLQFLCQFCNGGKMVYRRPTETVSQSIAGSLIGVSRHTNHNLLRQLVVVASLVHGRGRCETCGVGKGSAELSVVMGADPAAAGKRMPALQHWSAAWNLVALCYDCIGSA